MNKARAYNKSIIIIIIKNYITGFEIGKVESSEAKKSHHRMHSHQKASLVSFESESVVPSPRDLALGIAIVPLHAPDQRHHCLERV